MLVRRNHLLKDINTFGVNVKADYYVHAQNPDDLIQLIQEGQFNDTKKLIIGGGSNLLFTKDFDGLIILNNIKGITFQEINDNEVLVEANAGEVWHELVTECVNRNLHGIENLAFIPGKTGAAPVQNIGAYGTEQKEVFEYAEAMDLRTGDTMRFKGDECKFGYRDSIFKHEYKDNLIITKVAYKLYKERDLNLNYKDIQNELVNTDKHPDIHWVFDTVVKIRLRKLHDPKELGNCGSFFKNPMVSAEKYEELKEQYETVPGFPAGEGRIKLSAAWLIEQCGWKGKRLNEKSDAAVSPKHSLILVNHGSATGNEIKTLAYNIIDSVKEKFGVELFPEVNIIE
jgi:UDP-N-acetylmuramate dehydrogenase